MADDWERAPDGMTADDEDGNPPNEWRPAGSRELRADDPQLVTGWWLWDSSVSPPRWYGIVEVERAERITVHLDSSELLRVSFRPDIMVTVAPPR